jgi:hypothetical protein
MAHEIGNAAPGGFISAGSISGRVNDPHKMARNDQLLRGLDGTIVAHLAVADRIAEEPERTPD